jgi:hypothetical protein
VNPAAKYCNILRYLGPRVVTLRASTYLARALGTTRRRYAPIPWESIRLREIARDGVPGDNIAYARWKRENAPEFLYPLGQPPRVPGDIRRGPHERQPALAERLKLLAEDRCVYFFRTPSPTPIDWCANPINRGVSDPDANWFEISTYAPQHGDPRTFWEPGRAAWAIDLARASAHGFQGHAGELYWRWVDSFMKACPPFRTIQWMCGQESAVRLIAITLGFWSLADDRASTPKRWLQFARLAWATGQRIAHHINYAISQKNNHAISEACGLMLIGHLFPEFTESDAWSRRGRAVMLQELRRQIYDDGTYVQQSMNYQRVMLQGALLGLRLAELAGEPFPRDVYDRLSGGAEFLFQMMDPATGRLPNYGNNDGAWVLPLNECDFTDFRPVIQAVYYLCHHRRMLPRGPWDEDLLWLFGPEAVMTEDVPPRRPQSAVFETGGYYTIRRDESWAMTRCHTYRDRMAQCDGLHVDLWWRGQNILQDCGTYQYRVPRRPDIEAYFKGPAGQNSVEIDGTAALENVSRFLWLPWTRAKLIDRQLEGTGPQWLTGELYDYDRRPWKVLHRRTLLSVTPSIWVMVDDLIGSGVHRGLVRWHLFDAPYKITADGHTVHLVTPQGDVYVSVAMPDAPLNRFEVIRGRDEPGAVQGFAAPYYSERIPIPTVEAEYAGPLQMRFVTGVGLGERLALVRPTDDADEQVWGLRTSRGTHRLTLAGPFRPITRVVRGCALAQSAIGNRPHQGISS